MTRNSIVNIIINDKKAGSVGGRRERLTGTAGIIQAHANHRYEFVNWTRPDGSVFSSNPKLNITNWTSQTLHANFRPIILTHQDFIDADALETENWLLETNGYPFTGANPVYGYLYRADYVRQFFTAGNWLNRPNTYTPQGGTLEGQTYDLYPCRWGYNYGDPDDTGPLTTVVGGATYDPVTNTKTGTFRRSPTSHSQLLSGLDVTKLEGPGGNNITMGVDYTQGLPGNPTYGHSWNTMGRWNNPTDGSAPSMYPLMQYSRVKMVRTYTALEPFDLAGLEDLNATYLDPSVYYSSPAYVNYVRDLDVVAYWDNLREFVNPYGSNHSYAVNNYVAPGSINDTRLHTIKNSTRILDPIQYNHNVRSVGIAHGWQGPSESNTPHHNIGWHDLHKNTPNCNSMLALYRYNPLVYLQLGYHCAAQVGTPLDYHYKNVKHMSLSRPWYGGRITDHKSEPEWNFKSLKNLDYLYWDQRDWLRKHSLDWVKHTPKLRYFYSYGSLFTTGTPYLTAARALKNVEYVYMQVPQTLNFDPTPDEKIKVFVKFDQPRTNDLTRYSHPIINRGGTITPV